VALGIGEKVGIFAGLIGLGALGAFLWSAVRKSSGDEDGASGAAPDPGSGPDIVQTVGKHWILTNKIVGTSKAANYGWHFPGPMFDGMSFEATVSLPGVRVIQGIGTRHDAAHADYSQTVVLARQECIYQGEPRRLADLLVDPEASKLLSVEGPLQIVRQPGVQPWDGSSAAGPADPVTREQVVALPDNLAQRSAQILAWIEQGLGEYQWTPITTGELTFWVFADALKLGGVRINASAKLEQQIADRLDASLLTARMADLVYAAASRVILPIPLGASPQMASTAWMVSESDKIDTALAT
jgi:hypothetical protein